MMRNASAAAFSLFTQPFIGKRDGLNSIASRRKRASAFVNTPACLSENLPTPPNDAPPFVVIDGVSKTFGAKMALQQVSWSIPRGQISGLLGPNGAGKTTLFRLLMGILQSTAGTLRIDGRDCFEDRVNIKRLVGFLPDEPVFYSYLSGREILELSAGMHGLDPVLVLARLEPLIARLGMTEAMPQYADDYSRGMKKKLGLLLALLHQPPLLILDEPTNGLDVEATRLFFDLMREQAGAGTTIVFSTHLMDQVERLCSHAAIIHRGRLITAGPLAALLEGRSLEEVFVALTSTR
jgi:ABC-type multidrug transport system ATPase subunit